MRRRWQETRAAFERGWYEHEGHRVDLSAGLDAMRAGIRLHHPGELRRLPFPEGRGTTRVEVTDESTLEAVERLAGAGGGAGRLAALNFASARNPGGGVARGARAQEESLARASALYDALVRCPEFYAFHRDHPDPFYSDQVVYAPDVPVFRRDDGSWLPAPLPVAFLTSAAPNRRMIERDRPGAVGRIPGALATRARGVLAVAAHHGHSRLVLGAWGCGVFGNEPAEVAEAFAAHLRGDFAGVFTRVVFAVLDRDGTTREPFERALPGMS
ncbi:TIGR02452 family protein [Streptomyces avicenniae]|uniref:TIGR02452 family protein n=1 Tax=Streptomyces avicenniae TaxID=500153 RepID=UPI00069A698E|nr:TIGR02452 family protein [Streptomyces avicenniae]